MEFFSFAKEVGNVSGIGVIFLIFYILYKDGILSFGAKKNGKNGHGTNGTALLSAQMTELQQHFNHETTKLLQEIRDASLETNLRLEEWEKYGAPPPRQKL